MQPRTMWEQAAFNEGWRAYFKCLDCPYRSYGGQTKLRRWWQRGYDANHHHSRGGENASLYPTPKDIFAIKEE